ncbi:MAG: cobalamin biosynthesis protein CbiG [Rubritepida sp.]|nr:cobalamin biosynthesis protein CbiG [Rubritepida sp.]
MSLVAGIGCRRGAPAEAVAAALALALHETGRARQEVTLMATIAHKRDEPAIIEAARALGIELAIVDGASQPVLTESAASRAATGLGSVAEASALAAAGPGARLLAQRSTSGGATCALAETAS